MNDMLFPEMETASGYRQIIKNISNLNWAGLDRDGISAVAWAYYFFSIQFRENLEVACRLHPEDPALEDLRSEECNTDNLSPWPGVTTVGEKVDHDEFMRRVLLLTVIDAETRVRIEQAGQAYLRATRSEDDMTRAISITSYEDGGLEAVFTAILKCQVWDTDLLQGFKHFLVKHIGFDSNPDAGHGAMIRHLTPDERINGLWMEFFDLLVISVPQLLG